MTIREDLIRDEDLVRHAYQDSLGVWTCGVGFNIDKDHGGDIPLPVINFWLDYKINEAENVLDKTEPWWRGRPEVIQRALLNMCFNMGISRLGGFKRMLAALHAGDYQTAHDEALASQWATQVGDRAVRVANLFLSAKDLKHG